MACSTMAVDFEIVQRNGRAPFPYENGLKDTAYVGENARLELLMTFRPALPVDPNQPVLGKYVMHCHNLVHEDHAMMSEYDLQPGNAAAPSASASASASAQHATAAGHGRRSMMVQWELRPELRQRVAAPRAIVDPRTHDVVHQRGA
jgi:hypothetical protein